MNVLIIEDEALISDTLISIIKNIEQVNIVDTAFGFEEGFSKSLQESFDLILVDINLGENMNGIDLCESIRKTKKDIPLIIVTSYLSDYYLEKAFSIGVNDYITKPFNRKEIELRVKRWLLLSHKVTVDTLINYKNLFYDIEKNEFIYDGKKLILTKKEKILLLIFLKNSEKVLSIDFLSQKIWGDYEQLAHRNIRSNIQLLKRTLLLQGSPILQWIHNKRGEGYIFESIEN